MLRRILVLAALAATAGLGLTATASPAQAEERRCYSPQVGGFDTFDVCYYLPLPELSS